MDELLREVPLIEPECAPFYFLNGCEIEVKEGMLYFVGWINCNGGTTEERRIIVRGALPLAVAMELRQMLSESLSQPRGH